MCADLRHGGTGNYVRRMEFRYLLFFVALVLSVVVPARAQQDGKEAIRQSLDALRNVPVFRVKMVATDLDTKKVSGNTVEMTQPGLTRMVVEADGQVQAEVISDGKTTYFRRGVVGKFELAPPAVGETIRTVRQMMIPDLAMQSITNVTMVGREKINGVAATIYSYDDDGLGTRATMKLWISDKDRLALRSETDVDGEIRLGASDAIKLHRHAVLTYDYDPSIKITLPDGH